MNIVLLTRFTEHNTREFVFWQYHLLLHFLPTSFVCARSSINGHQPSDISNMHSRRRHTWLSTHYGLLFKLNISELPHFPCSESVPKITLYCDLFSEMERKTFQALQFLFYSNAQYAARYSIGQFQLLF